MSHPTGVRGLKSQAEAYLVYVAGVAPHWGAWIEIVITRVIRFSFRVAPHWGAWIEIDKTG